MKLILDTSALLSGKDFFTSEEHKLYTTPAVSNELKQGPRKHPHDDDWSDIARKLEFLISAGLKIKAPSEAALAKIRAVANQTKDLKRLSDTDLEILALAFELGEPSEEVIILTDDYSIQNLAVELGIKYIGITEKGITHLFHWKYKCTGCGKTWGEPQDICPVCGSKVKTIPDKKIALQKE